MTDTDSKEVSQYSNDNQDLSARIKCRLLGHDWWYRRRRGERECLRCRVKESYSVDESHADESAAKGQRRIRIEDGELRVEVYSCTAHGPDSEYWQWWSTSIEPVDEGKLLELKEEIETYLETGQSRSGSDAE